AGADVGLVLAHDLVGDAGTAVLVLELHGGAEHHLAGVRQLRRVDDLGVGELHLDLLNAALDEALLLARRVVLGVLRQVAVAARLGNGLDDRRARLRLEALELGAQRLGAAQRHGGAPHAESASWCRSCRRFTSTSSRWSSASQVASPAAMVV